MTPPDQGDAARRYLAIVQAPDGYAPPGQLDKTPPDGPEPPMIYSVVKADEHEAEVGRWKELAQQRYDGIEEQGRIVKRLHDALLDVRVEATAGPAGWMLSNHTFEKVRVAIEEPLA